MTTIEKERIADEIIAFHNTDFSDCPELTDEQLAQARPSRLRGRKDKSYRVIPGNEPAPTPDAVPAEAVMV